MVIERRRGENSNGPEEVGGDVDPGPFGDPIGGVPGGIGVHCVPRRLDRHRPRPAARPGPATVWTGGPRLRVGPRRIHCTRASAIRPLRPGQRSPRRSPGSEPRAEHPVDDDVGAFERPVQVERPRGPARRRSRQSPTRGTHGPGRARGTDRQARPGPDGAGSPARPRPPAPGTSGRPAIRFRARRGRPNGAALRPRHRGGRTRSIGPGGPRTLHAPATRAPAPTPRSASPGRREPSRAKLWPRTASTAVAVRARASITMPELGCRALGPERRAPATASPSKTIRRTAGAKPRSPAGRRPSRESAGTHDGAPR